MNTELSQRMEVLTLVFKLINIIICFMTLHRIQDSVHISFAKMLPTTAALTAKLLNPEKTASHARVNLSFWNSFCMILLTSFAQGFEARSFLNKQESYNDNTSANLACRLGTEAVRAKAGEGERAVCLLLPPLASGEPHSRLLSGAHIICHHGEVNDGMRLLCCSFHSNSKFIAVTKRANESTVFLLLCGVSLLNLTAVSEGTQAAGSTCSNATDNSYNGCTLN